MFLGVDNYDAFFEALGIIGRNDLAIHLPKTSNSPESSSDGSAKKDSLNLSEITCRCNVKKDMSEICAVLKSYHLTNYGKINEVQPPLKSTANIDLMHNFFDLCIVDAVNSERDAVYSVVQKKFLKERLHYTPIPYNEIFMKEKSVMLISGIAGIGKTWLLRKCLLD
ncbi:uncharacterized protein LOC136076765 isoform X2 [Hydra vulgaris]|uniref:Uncharacterized protein LOC136076765 isoform X2 n=1 Tax=Hydra vulgaris TaxID=6087 RepID=A0ABM4BBK7_HYDVU